MSHKIIYYLIRSLSPLLLGCAVVKCSIGTGPPSRYMICSDQADDQLICNGSKFCLCIHSNNIIQYPTIAGQSYFNVLQLEPIGTAFVTNIASGITHHTGFTNPVIAVVVHVAMCPQLDLRTIQDEF